MSSRLTRQFASLLKQPVKEVVQEIIIPVQEQVKYGTVSIVIAARNNGKYLTETIESCLNQSVPTEVIYSDDSSYDDSLPLARSYESKGLVVLAGSYAHQGVCVTRNKGASVAHGDYLIFIDGDDIMPFDFVEKHLQAMQSGCPFTYCRSQCFNESGDGHLWPAPEWDAYDMWLVNAINTSAMYAVWAFKAAGQWDDTAGSMWDWNLSIRASRFGKPKRSSAILRYRQHDDSWSTVTNEREKYPRSIIAKQIRRKLATISIGTVFSGRLPSLIPKWFSSIAQAARLLNKPEFVILDNSNNPALKEKLYLEASRYPNSFQSIRILSLPEKVVWGTEKERRDRSSTFLAKAYNILRYEMFGDIHWLIEDDIIVPMLGGQKLWESLTDGDWTNLPNAVAGCYRCRHPVSTSYIAGYWNKEHVEEIQQLSDSIVPFRIDVTGTGCLMYWKDRTPKEFKSHVRGVPAHDWAWCMDLKDKGGILLLHPEIRCGHAILTEEIIQG